MENRNNNNISNIFSNQTFNKFQTSKNSNLLDNYELIQYNGLRIPRFPLYNPILMKPFIPPIIYMDSNFYKELTSNKNEKELFIYLSENDYNKDKGNNDYINYSQKTSSSDLIKNDEKNNKINNNFLKNNKKNNLIQPSLVSNIKGKINEDIKLNINENKTILNNEINRVNKEINNLQSNNMNILNINYNKSSIENQNKYIKKPTEKLFHIEQDLSSTSSLNNSTKIQSKELKSLFIIKEDLNSKISKEENDNKPQDILIKKKRGRKQINNNKKTHTASDDDNIHRKIQVHFISFLTNFINDVIKSLIKSKKVPLFKKIDYQLKKIVNQKYFKNLKSQKIADILQMRPSPKMKKHDNNVNKLIYDEVCKLCPFMKDFLQQDFISLFKEYYYNKQKNFIVNGVEIKLSDRTRNFTDLINKNYAYKEKIKLIALNYFLEDDKAYEKLRFITNYQDNNVTG